MNLQNTYDNQKKITVKSYSNEYISYYFYGSAKPLLPYFLSQTNTHAHTNTHIKPARE